MSATLTTFGRQKMIGLTFLGSTVAPLTDLWVALTVQPAFMNSTGQDLVAQEPPASLGYVRKQYGIGSGYWKFGTGSTLVSTQSVTFPAATGGDWNWISGWALVTGATAGDVVMSGALKSAVVVYKGDQVTIAAGGMSVALYG